jgi:hypothetical protein
MSSPLAIAGVSAVLRDLLNNAMIDHAASTTTGSAVAVTALSPDRIKTAESDTPQLNVFLYQVSPNQGWRNAGLPSFDNAGLRTTNPPLALDLHYLVTAYGNTDFVPEILLGYAMQRLHETPVLRRDAIRTALGGVPPVTGSILPGSASLAAAADLADQIEQLKITPVYLNTDEMFKLWSAFQAPYRSSVAYVVTVVLIESSRQVRASLPVRERAVFVLPFRRPEILAAEPQIVTAGGTLTLTGSNLTGEITRVRFGAHDVTPLSARAGTVTAVLPALLRAGVNTVQIVHPLDLGTATEPHGGFASNAVAFMLAPQITSPAPFTVARGATLTLSVSPPVGRAQRAALIAGDNTIAIPARSAAGPPETTTLDVPIPPDFPVGSVLVRVQIDGAESPLLVDTVAASPTFNRYIGPNLNVT